MSVVDTNVIDAIAITEDKQGIALLISDHLDWDDLDQHLSILQNKINAYITYLEEKQYSNKNIYKNVSYAIIDINFLYDIPLLTEQFLQMVQDQIGEMGIMLECTIAGDDDGEE